MLFYSQFNASAVTDDRETYTRGTGLPGAGNNSVETVNVILAADCSRNPTPRAGVAVRVHPPCTGCPVLSTRSAILPPAGRSSSSSSSSLLRAETRTSTIYEGRPKDIDFQPSRPRLSPSPRLRLSDTEISLSSRGRVPFSQLPRVSLSVTRQSRLLPVSSALPTVASISPRASDSSVALFIILAFAPCVVSLRTALLPRTRPPV